MKNYKVHISLALIVLVLSVSSFTSIPLANSATQFSTLADSLNATITNVNWAVADSWTSTMGAILAGQGLSAFDNAMNQDLANGNYNDALFVARLANISGYSSPTITAGTVTALQQMPMAGSLPNNFNAQSYGDPNSGCYLVYDRFFVWAYQYAQQYGLTSKWNAQQAFNDFSKLYNKPPTNSHSGEMLFADPAGNWAYSYTSRYYDEYAETMSVFIQLAEIGVPGALAYADKAWISLQALWNGKYYIYQASWPIIECESGNFAQVIAEYMQLKGGISSIPYWSRVMQDLDYKLLVNGWSSPGWSSIGVIVHGANGANTEQRLWETLGVMTALQGLYPYFNSTMQSSFDSIMLGSSKAWQGLMSCKLNVGGYFKGASGDATTSNDATACAAATLFLDGIVPVTGSLAIPIHNEQYQDDRSSFPVTEFQFSYINNQISIPVNAGTITFTFGTTPVSYNFPSNGNYTVQFASDWNSIISVNGQPIPTPTSTPSPTPSPTPTPTPTPTATPSPTPTPTATPPVLKTQSVSVTTDKSSYARGSSVAITVTVKDASSGTLIPGASVTVKIINPSGLTMTTHTGTTSSAGTTHFTYQTGYFSTRGTWTISTSSSLNGYQSWTGQTKFTLT